MIEENVELKELLEEEEKEIKFLSSEINNKVGMLIDLESAAKKACEEAFEVFKEINRENKEFDQNQIKKFEINFIKEIFTSLEGRERIYILDKRIKTIEEIRTELRSLDETVKKSIRGVFDSLETKREELELLRLKRGEKFNIKVILNILPSWARYLLLSMAVSFLFLISFLTIKLNNFFSKKKENLNQQNKPHFQERDF